MFASLLLLTIGCLLRVSSEVIAYQMGATWAWSVLPFSAVLEVIGASAVEKPRALVEFESKGLIEQAGCTPVTFGGLRHSDRRTAIGSACAARRAGA